MNLGSYMAYIFVVVNIHFLSFIQKKRGFWGVKNVIFVCCQQFLVMLAIKMAEFSKKLRYISTFYIFVAKTFLQFQIP